LPAKGGNECYDFWRFLEARDRKRNECIHVKRQGETSKKTSWPFAFFSLSFPVKLSFAFFELACLYHAAALASALSSSPS
jgi:transcriptional antiterminator Rof (Rho-off)